MSKEPTRQSAVRAGMARAINEDPGSRYHDHECDERMPFLRTVQPRISRPRKPKQRTSYR